MTDCAAILASISTYDFMELVAFESKVRHEGSREYAWENYPPVFRDPRLIPLETDREGFGRLYRASKALRDRWWADHQGDSVDLHNAHVGEARTEENRRCVWAVRFAHSNVFHCKTERMARSCNGDDGENVLLRRDDADSPWVEVRA